MKEKDSRNIAFGIFMVQVLFIVLKIAGEIEWGWLFVFSPFVGFLSLTILELFVIDIIHAINGK